MTFKYSYFYTIIGTYILSVYYYFYFEFLEFVICSEKICKHRSKILKLKINLERNNITLQLVIITRYKFTYSKRITNTTN